MYELISIKEFMEGDKLRINCTFSDGTTTLTYPLIVDKDIPDIEKQLLINKLVEDINTPEEVEEE